MIINEDLLKLYAQNNFNVLLSGRHGVGKTEIIKSVFNSVFGVDNWAYFSASTMDAWVDFIGVPKAVDDGNGNMVLDLIRPARFQNGQIQALFFDEFNRAPAKVRNAVMELIQFKSINGRKFPNLKVIWGAVNPHDEENTYDVDQIDPAQLDRFQIQIPVPYKIDRGYLKSKHGIIAVPFCEWWSKLTKENQYKISPRRLEDAIRVHKVKGDLEHVLPVDSGISDLLTRISNVSLDDEWRDVLSMTDAEKAAFFTLETVQRLEKYILDNFESFAKYVPEDLFVSNLELKKRNWLESTLSNQSAVPVGVKEVMVKNYKNEFDEVIKSLMGLMPKGSLDLKGKNVVITGKFMKSYKFDNGGSPTRPTVESFLNQLGASIQDKVGTTTDYLIAANILNTSSKLVTAQKFVQKGTLTILQEEDFHAAYGNV